MKERGMNKMTLQTIAEVEKIRRGFEMGSQVGVTSLGRSTKWREDLERLGAMQIVDRNQTTAILLKPESFQGLMTYLDQVDEKLEQAQIEVLFNYRKDTTDFLSGNELATKAKESFRARKEQLRGFLDGDK
ncbi:hypothetical protein [Paenisporosarcina sp. TG20]|uniref:hypothetical protein n=1 Tax=Paenisporosarcina sp. TG20 TaxID=1211706 RepID=UPI0003019765|nr:hypothetical protein [Paenisporosarcina sp. TG20]